MAWGWFCGLLGPDIAPILLSLPVVFLLECFLPLSFFPVPSGLPEVSSDEAKFCGCFLMCLIFLGCSSFTSSLGASAHFDSKTIAILYVLQELSLQHGYRFFLFQMNIHHMQPFAESTLILSRECYCQSMLRKPNIAT